MAAAPPKIVLHFFNLAGRGRAIRIVLALGKVASTTPPRSVSLYTLYLRCTPLDQPYEDRRYSYDEFEKCQTAGEWPFGAVPALDVDGERLAQSCTLLRYAGKLAGLYPADPLAAARTDMAVDAMEEL